MKPGLQGHRTRLCNLYQREGAFKEFNGGMEKMLYYMVERRGDVEGSLFKDYRSRMLLFTVQGNDPPLSLLLITSPSLRAWLLQSVCAVNDHWSDRVLSEIVFLYEIHSVRALFSESHSDYFENSMLRRSPENKRSSNPSARPPHLENF